MKPLTFALVIIFYIATTTSTTTTTTTTTTGLRCRLTNHTVQLNITLEAPISKHTLCILQTRNIHTNKTETYEQCRHDTTNVDCSVWSGKKARHIIRKYYHVPYEVKLIDHTTRKTIWSRDIGELNDLMYSCIDDHSITDLKIACHGGGRQLDWRRQQLDVDYDLIQKHSINIGPRILNDNFDCDNHLIVLCNFPNLHKLDECGEQHVCVKTFFKGRPDAPLEQCTSTRDMCNKRCTKKKQTHFRLIVSVTLSVAAAIMVMLAATVLFRRFRRRPPDAIDIDDDDEPITPRSDTTGLGDFGVSPRDDHFYAYPDVVCNFDSRSGSDYEPEDEEKNLLCEGVVDITGDQYA